MYLQHTKPIAQKPHLLKIIPRPEDSIVVKGDEIAWNNPWHYHPEIELLYCIKGKGTNFIGNCIRTIEEGEVLLLGKNLPHTRQRDRDYYLPGRQEKPESVVVQFREDFLGEHFFAVPEFHGIRHLIERSARGLKFIGKTRERIVAKLLTLREASPLQAILELLSVLDIMARSEEVIYLNPVNYISTAHEKSSQKINKVYHYTLEHFREPIELRDVAALTNHSPSAFCRYFKTRTRKSYFHYLNEVRVAYSCGLLMESDMNISQVCFASGFNNLSHFRKQFRNIIKLTPGEYRSQGKKKYPEGFSSGL